MSRILSVESVAGIESLHFALLRAIRGRGETKQIFGKAGPKTGT